MHTAPAPVTFRGPETRSSEPALLGAGLFAAVLFSPSLLDVVLVANLAALVVVALLHLAAASLSRARVDVGAVPRARRWTREPFVSAHVPVGGEPLDVVARTLEALRRLEWSALEVVVAGDLSRASELQRLCARLGPRFRFTSAPSAVAAARGVALDLCLAASDPRAELVLVVDPGVRVHPKLLLRAARYFDAPGISHVQFQAARASSTGGRSLAGERASHVGAFLPFGEAAEASLPCGSPCLVQRRALTLVGGWGGARIGEDAALGVRLAEHGYRGRFAPEAVSRGALPLTLGALREERRRRVFGHAHTLFHLEGKTLRSLGFRRALAVVTQLTSGFDFLLLPALALPLLAFVPHASGEHPHALLAASLAFPLHALAHALLSLVAPRVSDDGDGAVRSVLARLGFAWEGSTAWLQALFGVRLASPGDGKAPRSGHARDAAVPLFVAATLAASSVGFLGGGEVGAAFACVLAAWMFGTVLYVQWDLSHAARWRQPDRADAQSRAVVVARLPRPAFGGRTGAVSGNEARPDLEQRPRWHLRDVDERPRALGGAEAPRPARGP